MAGEIGTLRAGYGLDPRGYTRGATEVVRQNERMAASGRNLDRSITTSNRNMRRGQFALQQLAFGVEDAASQFGTTGLSGAFRAAGNNVSQFFAIIHPLAGVVASLATGAVAVALTTRNMGDAAGEAAKKEKDFADRLKERQKAMEDTKRVRGFRGGVEDDVRAGRPEKIMERADQVARDIQDQQEVLSGVRDDIQDEFQKAAQGLVPFVEEETSGAGRAKALRQTKELREEKVREFVLAEKAAMKDRRQAILNETDARRRVELEGKAREAREALGLQISVNSEELAKQLQVILDEFDANEGIKKTKEEVAEIEKEINILLKERQTLEGAVGRAADQKRIRERTEFLKSLKETREGIFEGDLDPFDKSLRDFNQKSEERLKVLKEARGRKLADDEEVRRAEQSIEAQRLRLVEQADPRGEIRTSRGLRDFAFGGLTGFGGLAGGVSAAAQIGSALKAVSDSRDLGFSPSDVAAVSKDQFDIGAFQRSLIPDRLQNATDNLVEEAKETNQHLKRVNDSVKELKEDPVG